MVSLNALLLIICIEAVGNSENFDCSSNPAQVSHVTCVPFNKDPITNTVISTSIIPHQALRFEVKQEASQQLSVSRKSGAAAVKHFVTIELLDVWQEFDVKNAYNFAIPELKVGCFCECPDKIKKCNRNHQYSSFKTTHSVTVRQYTTGHASDGCLSAAGTADVCCNITLTAESGASRLYRAVNVQNPITMYKFKIAAIDENNKAIFEEELQIGADTARIDIQNGFVSIRGTSVSSPLPSGWYFVHPSTKALMTNFPINDDHGQNIRKLGWFKIRNDESVSDVDPLVIQTAFNPMVINCADNKYEWSFSGVGWKSCCQQSMVGSQVLDVYKSTVREIQVAERYLTVRYVSYSPITIDVQFNFQAKVIFHTGSSFYKRDARVEIDVFPNRISKKTAKKSCY